MYGKYHIRLKSFRLDDMVDGIPFVAKNGDLVFYAGFSDMADKIELIRYNRMEWTSYNIVGKASGEKGRIIVLSDTRIR